MPEPSSSDFDPVYRPEDSSEGDAKGPRELEGLLEDIASIEDGSGVPAFVALKDPVERALVRAQLEALSYQVIVQEGAGVEEGASHLQSGGRLREALLQALELAGEADGGARLVVTERALLERVGRDSLGEIGHQARQSEAPCVLVLVTEAGGEEVDAGLEEALASFLVFELARPLRAPEVVRVVSRGVKAARSSDGEPSWSAGEFAGSETEEPCAADDFPDGLEGIDLDLVEAALEAEEVAELLGDDVVLDAASEESSSTDLVEARVGSSRSAPELTPVEQDLSPADWLARAPYWRLFYEARRRVRHSTGHATGGEDGRQRLLLGLVESVLEARLACLVEFEPAGPRVLLSPQPRARGPVAAEDWGALLETVFASPVIARLRASTPLATAATDPATFYLPDGRLLVPFRRGSRAPLWCLAALLEDPGTSGPPSELLAELQTLLGEFV